jgi:Tol biopolymer transport system component
MRRVLTNATIVIAVASLSLSLASAQNPQEYGKPRICIADSDGGNVKLLFEVPEMASNGSPNWSSDGRYLIFDATPQPRRYDLSRMYVFAMSGPFKGTAIEIGCGNAARFSPDGSRIAFHVRPGNPDGHQGGIWVMRDDGTERKRLAEGTRPRWTADSKRLVFVNSQGNNLEIIGIDGEGQRSALKEGYATMGGSMVAPDGKELCFIAYRQGPYEGELCRVPLGDGEPGEPKVVYKGRIGWDPAWSPDGRQLMFWQMDDAANRHLYVIDADGKTAPQRLANQEGTRFNSDAQWSPDGKRIVFSSDREVATR